MIEKTSIPSQPTNSEPMKAAGLLDGLNQKITVPAIGTEFLDVDLVEMMEATNSDELLRDLAITSSLFQPFMMSIFFCLHLFFYPFALCIFTVDN
jgi:hypothetical protein